MSLGGFGATKRCWLEKRQKQVTDRYMDQFLMGVENSKIGSCLRRKIMMKSREIKRKQITRILRKARNETKTLGGRVINSVH